ncbi:hypothetical protein BGZ80_007209 [Entomortierella chlamydospora]|uniref:Uncharacterized protein n=1 Tax=Entomortierella chlamydospora TaxID=101097 RepID=A0A9P6SSG2_9FUNG|nr:hypothetical protein BGZ79_000879 [Entomortierella chlamydospora]KAF9996601.1 hypothetical protein BGZ80_007209 [Entomortierella chlamydospora]
MLQPATIAAIAPAPSSTPRTPKQNRKSGISIALQNQSQNQSNNNTINNNNNNNKNNATNISGNNNSNSNQRSKRNPTHTHARHQSMPAQSRPMPGSPPSAVNTNDSSKGSSSNNAANLKRSSASVVAPTPSSSAVSGIQILKNQQASQGSAKQNHNNNEGQRNNQKNRSSGQAQQGNSNNNKSKRNQRRKDVEASADSTFKTEMDAAALPTQSPPLNPSTPPSSTDSDDSESAALHLNPHPRPRPVKGQSNRQNGRSSKGNPHLSGSPPQRPNSAPTIPQPRKGIPTHQKQQNNGNKHGGFARKPSFGSSSALPLDETNTQSRPNMSKSSSADEIMVTNRVSSEKKLSGLYAGPTFHNSPDPTSLPIPAFSRSSGTSPSESQAEKLPAPFFGEAASPQLNSMRPQRTQSETSGWMSHQSMPGMTPYQLSLGLNYNLPNRMATSGYITDGPMLHGSDQLMEITQSLRSILKIPSQ